MLAFQLDEAEKIVQSLFPHYRRLAKVGACSIISARLDWPTYL